MTPNNQEGELEREGEAPAEPALSTRSPTQQELPPPQRRHPVHGIKYVDGQPTIIFDTLCTKDRQPRLANDAFHAAFQQVALHATAWLMGRYVIMPDHIHFFAGDVGGDIPYENWVRYLKSQLTKQLNEQGSSPGGRGSRRAADFAWLTDHWDTRVRSAEAYELKWRYVQQNPQRKGLVSREEDWPYQGEIFKLRWT